METSKYIFILTSTIFLSGCAHRCAVKKDTRSRDKFKIHDQVSRINIREDKRLKEREEKRDNLHRIFIDNIKPGGNYEQK